MKQIILVILKMFFEDGHEIISGLFHPYVFYTVLCVGNLSFCSKGLHVPVCGEWRNLGPWNAPKKFRKTALLTPPQKLFILVPPESSGKLIRRHTGLGSIISIRRAAHDLGRSGQFSAF